MNDKPQKPINFNSILLLLVNALVIVVAYFAKGAYEDIKSNMVPRQEIYLRMEELKAANVRTDIEILSLRRDMSTDRAVVTQLQLDMVRLHRDLKP